MIVAGIVIFSFALSLAPSCTISSDEYASEVLIENYNFEQVPFIGEKYGDSYIFNSQYGNNLLTVLRETEFPKSLSVRLQLPTEIKNFKTSIFKITSFSLAGELNQNLPSFYASWRISCNKEECFFEKDALKITAPKSNPLREIVLEISRDLPSCSSSCLGICFSTKEDSKCIDSKTKSDLDAILKYSGLGKTAKEMFDEYEAEGPKEKIEYYLIQSSNFAVNWREAMKQELVSLSEENVISLSRADIEQIASISKKSQAGANDRIVYDNKTNSWKPYNRVENITLEKEKNCIAYPSLAKLSAEKSPINVFYLVPLIITVSAVSILVILIIAARVINSLSTKKEKKFKNFKTHERNR